MYRSSSQGSPDKGALLRKGSLYIRVPDMGPRLWSYIGSPPYRDTGMCSSSIQMCSTLWHRHIRLPISGSAYIWAPYAGDLSIWVYSCIGAVLYRGFLYIGARP